MHNILRKAALLSVCGVGLVLSGCASTDAVQKAQSTADQAMTTAQHAQSTADAAQSSASAAEQKAEAAQKAVDDLNAKVDAMQQAQAHKGPRG